MSRVDSFIANSDYPFDMITYYKSYTLTSDSNRTQTVQFAHGLPYTPLLFGTWGDKEDFSDDTGPIGDSGAAFSIVAAADSQNVYITKQWLYPQSGTKFYLRIYGFAPTSWTGDCAPTAQSSGALILDTDKEYAPLLAEGYVRPYNISAPRENTNYSFTIGKDGLIEIPTDAQQSALNLFYGGTLNDAPKVMIWLEDSNGKIQRAGWARFMSTGYPDGTVYPYVMYQATNGGFVTINTGMRSGTTPETKTHIRVYA
jgi:hypothetical protein